MSTHQENDETVRALSDTTNLDPAQAEQDFFEAIQSEIRSGSEFLGSDAESDDTTQNDVIDQETEELVAKNFETLLSEVEHTAVPNTEVMEEGFSTQNSAQMTTSDNDENVEDDRPVETESGNTVDEGQATPTEQAAPLPFWLSIKFLVCVALVTFLGIVGMIYQVFSDLDATPSTSVTNGQTVNSATTNVPQPSTISGNVKPPVSGPRISESESNSHPNTASIDVLWNGVDVNTQKDQADYTDSDPITRERIATLQNQLNVAKEKLEKANELNAMKESELQRTAKRLDETLQTVIKKNADLEALKKKWDQEIETVRQLNKRVADGQNQVSSLQSDLMTEKKLTLREKEAKELAEQRYSELLASQSKEFIELKNSVSNLEGRFDDVLSERQLQEAKKYLSQLSLISVDTESGVGKFAVIRNGQALKPITLKSGEELKGRGIVSRIDPYGCITFEDGQSYEPLNGYCP